MMREFGKRAGPDGKDQTPCTQCGRLYCEGFWGEGVCTKDMHFGGEPTADFDEKGRCLRIWYEANRESWWDRHKFFPFAMSAPDRDGVHADEFILGLINEVSRIGAECKRQIGAR